MTGGDSHSPRLALRLGTALLCALYLFLVLPGLGNLAFWNDEAATALIARNILDTGLPHLQYGENPLASSQIDANFAGLESAHGWLGYYVCAASFALFGESTFTGRLPFAVAGAIAVVAVIAIGATLFGTAGGLIAGTLLAVNPFFLQYARQCRYYTLAMLFTALVVYVYLRVRRGEAKWHWLPVTAFFLFHSSQLFFVVVFGAVFLVDLAGRLRNENGVEPDTAVPWGRVALGCAALIGPWLVFFAIGRASLPHGLAVGDAFFGQLAATARFAGAYFPFLLLLGLIPIHGRRLPAVPAAVAVAAGVLLALVPGGLFAAGGGFATRYVFFLLPIGAVVAARGVLVLRDARVVAGAAMVFCAAYLAGLVLPANPVNAMADDARHIAVRLIEGQRYYRHPPKPDPEAKALDAIEAAAKGVGTVLVGGSAYFQTVYRLGPGKRVRHFWVEPKRPDEPYLVVIDPDDVFKEVKPAAPHLLDGCVLHECAGCSLHGWRNWPERGVFRTAPDRPLRIPMRIWRCGTESADRLTHDGTGFIGSDDDHE